MRMVEWVENDDAPQTITGIALVNGTLESGIAFKRNHCKWLARNHYRGSGDPNNADSWKCI